MLSAHQQMNKTQQDKSKGLSHIPHSSNNNHNNSLNKRLKDNKATIDFQTQRVKSMLMYKQFITMNKEDDEEFLEEKKTDMLDLVVTEMSEITEK